MEHAAEVQKYEGGKNLGNDASGEDNRTKAPKILHKSSKELYRAVAKQWGITCKMSDHCRCLDCQVTCPCTARISNNPHFQIFYEYFVTSSRQYVRSKIESTCTVELLKYFHLPSKTFFQIKFISSCSYELNEFFIYLWAAIYIYISVTYNWTWKLINCLRRAVISTASTTRMRTRRLTVD